MVFDSGHEFELGWLKYRTSVCPGSQRVWLQDQRERRFPFLDMVSVRVAQALRKRSQGLLPAAERERLRESGFPPQIAIPSRDPGGCWVSPLNANSIGHKKFRLCRMFQICIA